MQNDSESFSLTHLITGESPNIYMERSGKASKRLSEALLRPPESPLSTEEAQEAIQYESDICDYLVTDEMSLEQLLRKRASIKSPSFYADAFIKGQVHIEGLEGSLRQLKNPDDVYTWLAQSAADQTIRQADFIEMARQSRVHYIAEMKQAVLREERPPDSLLNVMSIVANPSEALRFARAGNAARAFLMEERQRFKTISHGIDGAKRAFVDIYTKRINAQVLSNISLLEHLVDQSSLIDEQETILDAYQAMPSMLREPVADKSLRSSLRKRFDYINNGIGYDKDGRATAVDWSVFEDPVGEHPQEQGAPIFSTEEREILRDAKMTKEEMKALFKDILADKGMLSAEEETTWSPGRGNRAEDELFQVVYHLTKATFAVNGTDGIISTPSGERSIYDVLTVGAHELEHINQNQADRELGKHLRIGDLKGRRVSMLRETGANLVQRQLERELFGESKPIAYAYARAIQSLEAGGDVVDATFAFYNEKIQSNLKMSRVAAAEEAADRVLRVGSSSAISSAAMSYAEENIMSYELASSPPEVRRRATQLTTLDLDDQVRLHTFGLLPEINEGAIDWTTTLLKHMQPYIKRALEAAK